MPQIDLQTFKIHGGDWITDIRNVYFVELGRVPNPHEEARQLAFILEGHGWDHDKIVNDVKTGPTKSEWDIRHGGVLIPPPATPPPGPTPGPAPPVPTSALIRTDFLTLQNAQGQYLNSGEYPVLNGPKQQEIVNTLLHLGYSDLLCETNWPGDAHVPAFDLLKFPQKMIDAAKKLTADGIRLIPLIGLEGCGRNADTGYVNQAREFAKALKPYVECAAVGIEVPEWADYETFKALVRAVKLSIPKVLAHFMTGAMAHRDFKGTLAEFYQDCGATGLMMQMNKKSKSGRFLVVRDDMLRQCGHVRKLLPAHIGFYVGEYANLVSQADAQAAGRAAVASGKVLGFFNGGPSVTEGVGLEFPTPVMVADEIDANQCTFRSMHGDITHEIQSWPIDSTIEPVTSSLGGDGKMVIHFPHNASGHWPTAPNQILGNIWEGGKVGGKFFFQTWDYLAPYDFDKQWDGTGLHLDAGSPLYMTITGPARDKFDGVRARCQIRRVSDAIRNR